MKKLLLIMFAFLFASTLFAQDAWNVVWEENASNTVVPGQNIENGSYNTKAWGVGDTDQDGMGEFIVQTSDLDTNYIQMYEATGDDAYEVVWTWKFTLSANTWYGCTTGDLDNNGVLDLIIGTPTIAGDDDHNPPRIWAFEWNGVVGENKYGNYSGGDEPVPNSGWNMGAEADVDIRPFDLKVEDIDLDGTNELIIGVRAGSSLRGVRVGSVTGTFTGLSIWNLEFAAEGLAGGSMYSMTTGDLDSDGNLEIHAFSWNKFTLRSFECTGDRQYGMVSELLDIYEDADYGAWGSQVITDMDGDGDNEMYIAGTEPNNQIFIITDVTDVSTMDSTNVHRLLKLPRVADGKLRSMQLADPDGDGKPNLMVAGERNGRVYDLEFQGGDPADSTNWAVNVAFDLFENMAVDTGVPVDTAWAQLSPRINYGYPCGDMDGDGKGEYVFINWSTDYAVWDNDGFAWVIEYKTPVGVQKDNDNIPSKINLGQNYPNPFNPETIISFSIVESDIVTLEIYDLLGQKVRTLVNQYTNSGNYSVTWNGLTDNGQQAASGSYIYNLRTNATQISKKMILLR